MVIQNASQNDKQFQVFSRRMCGQNDRQLHLARDLACLIHSCLKQPLQGDLSTVVILFFCKYFKYTFEEEMSFILGILTCSPSFKVSDLLPGNIRDAVLIHSVPGNPGENLKIPLKH